MTEGAPRLSHQRRRGAGRDRALPAALQRPLSRSRHRAGPSRPGGRSDPALDLGAILAFRHTRSVAREGNTVKYHWRTLQLLPSAQRPSYAGARVEVLERPGGELACPSPGRDHRLPARPTPLRRAARAPLRAGARPGAGAASPRASAPVAVHPARRRIRLGKPTEARSSTPLRPPSCARRPRGRRRAGSRFNRPYCRDSRCAFQRPGKLGISRNTIRRYERAGGPPAVPAKRHHLPSATSQTDIFAERVKPDKVR